jgi:hypothetical protein
MLFDSYMLDEALLHHAQLVKEARELRNSRPSLRRRSGIFGRRLHAKKDRL